MTTTLDTQWLEKDRHLDELMNINKDDLIDLQKEIHGLMVEESTALTSAGQRDSMSTWIPDKIRKALGITDQHEPDHGQGHVPDRDGNPPPYAYQTRDQIAFDFSRIKLVLMRLFLVMRYKKLVGIYEGDGSGLGELAIRSRFEEMFHLLTESYEALYYSCPYDGDPTLNGEATGEALGEAPGETEESRVCEMSISNLQCFWWEPDTGGELQHAVLYILKKIQNLGYRRDGEDCYRQVMHGGKETCFWEYVCSFTEVIHSCITKEDGYQWWANGLTSSKHSCSALKNYLECSWDNEFPRIQQDRGAFSFTNGVYFAHRNEFVSFDEIHGKDEMKDVATIQFFRHPFDPSHATMPDWRDIPCPEFDNLVRYQEYDDESLRWIYVFLGRVLYPVGARDNWQVGPMFKGVARSGKSTVALLVKCIFPPHQVGTLSSNGEDRFGLSSLYTKLIYVCTEVKKDFALSQGDWQSMVTGEEVSVPVKKETPQCKKWDVPGILCGNELPNWMDAAGSVVRRLVLFEFNRRVSSEHNDPNLMDKLKRNIGPFICKANRAYLEAVEEHGHQDIWKRGILSEQIRKMHERLSMGVDALRRFLMSPQCELRPHLYIPESDFLVHYRAFRVAEKLPPVTWTRDHWLNCFQEFGIKRETENQGKTWPPDSQSILVGPFFVGVGLSELVDVEAKDGNGEGSRVAGGGGGVTGGSGSASTGANVATRGEAAMDEVSEDEWGYDADGV